MSNLLREHGIVIGRLQPGPRNTISDVEGCRVGHATIVRGSGDLTVGEGPVRTGVTAVIPHPGDVWEEPRFAGVFALNGAGEWSGTSFVRETGCLYGPILTTNSHSLGTVRDAVIKFEVARRGAIERLPVVGETFDGLLNDISGMHVTDEHVLEALQTASSDFSEGSVGGGTGNVCHGFKGGIGSASRRVEIADQTYTVGILVQANHGGREEFQVAGVPVGRLIPTDEIPLGPTGFDRAESPHKNSVLVVVATDAPLLPGHLERLAHRATLGIARNGAYAHNLSGDMALAFSTAPQPPAGYDFGDPRTPVTIQTLTNAATAPLFEAAIEATEEAIVSALVNAETTEGIDRWTAYRLDVERLARCIEDYRGNRPPLAKHKGLHSEPRSQR
ncbi:P1 family peptidase [Dactylosporangium sp. CA-233914]|uniref:P1 family peptidase n=1 Tax=Dactylosporangium sp. CA-233914 TaxID=3239934 RepID=UPI003D936229